MLAEKDRTIKNFRDWGTLKKLYAKYVLFWKQKNVL